MPAYSTPLPLFDLIVYDDTQHDYAAIEHILHYHLGLTKLHAGDVIRQMRTRGEAIVQQIWFEAGEHYQQLLIRESAAADLKDLGRPLHVELKALEPC